MSTLSTIRTSSRAERTFEFGVWVTPTLTVLGSGITLPLSRRSHDPGRLRLILWIGSRSIASPPPQLSSINGSRRFTRNSSRSSKAMSKTVASSPLVALGLSAMPTCHPVKLSLVNSSMVSDTFRRASASDVISSGYLILSATTLRSLSLLVSPAANTSSHRS